MLLVLRQLIVDLQPIDGLATGSKAIQHRFREITVANCLLPQFEFGLASDTDLV